MDHLLGIISAMHYPPKGSLFDWLFGPQIIGFIFLVVGFIQYRNPPKKINNWYGYRSDTAKRNQFTWAEAQRYSSVLMIKMGAYVFVVGFLIVTAFNFSPLTADHRMIFVLLFYIAGAMVPALVIIVKTENHLNDKFGGK